MLYKDIDDLGQILADEKTKPEHKPFHIEIYRNDTGEILVDEDTNCIVCSYLQSAAKTAVLGFCEKATGQDILNTILGGEKSIRKMLSDKPELNTLYLMHKLNSIIGDEDKNANNHS